MLLKHLIIGWRFAPASPIGYVYIRRRRRRKYKIVENAVGDARNVDVVTRPNSEFVGDGLR